MKIDEILLYFSYIHNGDWNKIYDSIDRKEKVDQDELDEILTKVKCKFITILSQDYPEELKRIPCPPYVIYYMGNKRILSHKKKISVIGSRQHSDYAENQTRKIVSNLVKSDYVIVSGMAKGIDGIAHWTCLENEGKTIAILGSGFNNIYPKENIELANRIKKDGLILSEYPPDVGPDANNFPIRNRLIAALGQGVVIMEAKEKSGTLITVRYALEYNKDIYCLPYKSYEKSACNLLIKQGAKLIEDANDIIEDLEMQ